MLAKKKKKKIKPEPHGTSQATGFQNMRDQRIIVNNIMGMQLAKGKLRIQQINDKQMVGKKMSPQQTSIKKKKDKPIDYKALQVALQVIELPHSAMCSYKLGLDSRTSIDKNEKISVA